MDRHRYLRVVTGTDHGRQVMAMEDPTERPVSDVFFDGYDKNGTDYQCGRCGRVLAQNIPHTVIYRPTALECPSCKSLNERPYVHPN